MGCKGWGQSTLAGTAAPSRVLLRHATNTPPPLPPPTPPHTPAPTPPLRLEAARAVSDQILGTVFFRMAAGVRFRVPSGDGCFRTLTGNGRSAYRQTKKPMTVYRSSLKSPESGGVGDRGFFFISAIFKKKRKTILKKAESKKKKRNSAEKRKIDIPV